MHRIVASLVRAEPLPFLLNILRWLLVAIPATWTNSWLSYIQNKLSIAYRSRLTKEITKQYLGDSEPGPEGKVYYKLGMALSSPDLIMINVGYHAANLDDRIKNPDQCVRMTQKL
jgi:ATP-binding cassette, subfamily D (ALD), peroxisomal long-chain fatty acid import protein